MRNLLDRIAKRLGYLPKDLFVDVHVEWTRNQPTYVDVRLPGGWHNRVIGWVVTDREAALGITAGQRG